MKRASVDNPHSLVMVLLSGILILGSASSGSTQSLYKKAPPAIQRVLDALPTPQVNISPNGSHIIISQPSGYPSIKEFSEPMLRLAGLRINPITNGPSRPRYSTTYTLKSLQDEGETRLKLPTEARLGNLHWSPNGEKFAFTNTHELGIDLWVSGTGGTAHKIHNVVINAAYGTPIQWIADSKTLIIQRVPTDRGDPPNRPNVPIGPNIQETSGQSGPVRTYQDLLETAHDAELFDYYVNSQLSLIDTDNDEITDLGEPGLFQEFLPSPNGEHFLVIRLKKPYSYLFTHRSFPRTVEIWDRSGKVEQLLAEIPLQENVPIGGVPTSPRSYSWVPSDPATLTWVEALDDGNPYQESEYRDKLMALVEPFDVIPSEMFRMEERYRGRQWLTDGGALITEYDRVRRWNRTHLINSDAAPKLIWDVSAQDRYNDPGRPVSSTLANGHRTIIQDGEWIYLAGNGASPIGDYPFLDRLNLATLQSERLFRAESGTYEAIVAPLGNSGEKMDYSS